MIFNPLNVTRTKHLGAKTVVTVAQPNGLEHNVAFSFPFNKH